MVFFFWLKSCVSKMATVKQQQRHGTYVSGFVRSVESRRHDDVIFDENAPDGYFLASRRFVRHIKRASHVREHGDFFFFFFFRMSSGTRRRRSTRGTGLTRLSCSPFQGTCHQATNL